jgi:hypothetical protein
MMHDQDIRLPQDTLARGLTPEEMEQVAGGDTYESSIKPDTSSMVTGCNPPKNDLDWD